MHQLGLAYAEYIGEQRSYPQGPSSQECFYAMYQRKYIASMETLNCPGTATTTVNEEGIGKIDVNDNGKGKDEKASVEIQIDDNDMDEDGITEEIVWAEYMQDAGDDPAQAANNGIPNNAMPMRVVLADSIRRHKHYSNSGKRYYGMGHVFHHGLQTVALFADKHTERLTAPDKGTPDSDEAYVRNLYFPEDDKNIYYDHDEDQTRDADLDF